MVAYDLLAQGYNNESWASLLYAVSHGQRSCYAVVDWQLAPARFCAMLPLRLAWAYLRQNRQYPSHRTAEPFQGSATRTLRGFASGPAAEDVPQERRICFGQPLQDLWKVVCEGPGQAVGQTDFIAAQALAVRNELRPGAPRRALGAEGM
jgi:hypothetical protein